MIAHQGSGLEGHYVGIYDAPIGYACEISDDEVLGNTMQNFFGEGCFGQEGVVAVAVYKRELEALEAEAVDLTFDGDLGER
jgi:hypothetical protein